MVTLNLAPQPGETEGFSPRAHLEVLASHAPGLAIDVVLADQAAVRDAVAELKEATDLLSARLVLADIAAADRRDRHDPLLLAGALARIFEGE